MKQWQVGFLLLFAIPLASAARLHAESEAEAESDSGAAIVKAELPAAERGKPLEFSSAIAPLLAQHCTTCHGGESPKGDMSLAFANEQAVQDRLRDKRKHFEQMAEECDLAKCRQRISRGSPKRKRVCSCRGSIMTCSS
jgi:hypothetical protein